MYLTVFMTTVLLVQSAKGDCLQGVKECTKTYFADVSNNLFNKNLICQASRDYIKCIDMQNCFSTQSEREMFYQTSNAKFRNQLRDCVLVAGESSPAMTAYSIKQAKPSDQMLVAIETTTSMTDCSAKIESCLESYMFNIQALDKAHELSCNDLEAFAKCVQSQRCSITQSIRKQMIDGTQTVLHKLNCPFTMSKLLDRYKNNSSTATQTNVSVTTAVIIALLCLKKFVEYFN